MKVSITCFFPNLFIFAILVFQIANFRINAKKARRLDDQHENELNESTVDVREIMHEKEKDNPLSELWDANHMRVTKQSVNLNMNVPLNRLKLHLSSDYRVKIVVFNDEDFDRLYDYFHPKVEEELEKHGELEEHGEQNGPKEHGGRVKIK